LGYDSVQPGLLCFDFGTLVGFACRLSRPDERVLKKVRFDLDRYADMARAYINIMKPAFDKSEPASLAPGCVVMALELGIRYLSDYLTGNALFPASYPEQNLHRARTQLMLCMQMQYYFKEMENIIRRCLNH
ncbi:MAG: mucin desulfatase, partial [Oscillospiraceae bacterium]|nr:mucin desulfatase [Oscillospiraceae bacterium]